jgi:hypothetical protein
LHRGIDDDASKITGFHCASPGCDCQALLQQRLQPFFAHAIAPVGHRGAIERKPVLEELLPAEVLVIRVLDPEFAYDFVAEVVCVLEDRKPRHQPRRQRRLAWAILVNRAESLFQKSPVDGPRQLHQRVIHVDDLIEPRTKQILLAALPPLPWPHQNPPLITLSSRESWLQIRGNPQHEFARKLAPEPQFPANPFAAIPAISIAGQPLRDISRTTK